MRTEPPPPETLVAADDPRIRAHILASKGKGGRLIVSPCLLLDETTGKYLTLWSHGPGGDAVLDNSVNELWTPPECFYDWSNQYRSSKQRYTCPWPERFIEWRGWFADYPMSLYKGEQK